MEPLKGISIAHIYLSWLNQGFTYATFYKAFSMFTFAEVHLYTYVNFNNNGN